MSKCIKCNSPLHIVEIEEARGGAACQCQNKKCSLSGWFVPKEILEENQRLLCQVKDAYIAGYETGHNDTVESCYGDSEELAEDYIKALDEE